MKPQKRTQNVCNSFIFSGNGHLIQTFLWGFYLTFLFLQYLTLAQ